MSRQFYGQIKDLSIRPQKEWIEYAKKYDGKNIEIRTEAGIRSGAQNNSIHLWFDQVAKELNEKGLTIQKVLSKYKVELDWTGDSFKENVWRPIQKALTGKQSSTSLDKGGEIDTIYEHINRFLAQEGIDIHVPFPHDEKKEDNTKVEYPTEELHPKF